jgi:hypothetical protein
MSKKQLNGADVGALLQKVHGKCMSQGVRGDGLGNFANPVGFLALALHRRPANVLARYITGKEPVFGPFHSPPLSQNLQKRRGEHHVAEAYAKTNRARRTDLLCQCANIAVMS